MPHLQLAPLGRKRRALANTLALARLGPSSVGAAGISWIDWTATTPDGVPGTLRQGDENVQVNFTGTCIVAFMGVLPEPYGGPVLQTPGAPS
jgi:hypothetical protein